MFNPNSTKVPFNVFPTHKLTSPVSFITESKFIINGNNQLAGNPTLQENTEVLVLEHGMGRGAKWAKVSTNDQRIGYVMISGNAGNNLQPLQNIKPFFSLSTSPKHQPNPEEPEIDWKKQKPNIPYRDLYNGAFVVHFEKEDVIEFGDKNSLYNFMNEARFAGAELILKEAGISYTTGSNGTLEKLLNDYYLFCSAEDWFIDPRPCSTLRVAVSIPTRYLYSNSALVKREETTATPLPPPTAINPNDPKLLQQQNPDLFILEFENYAEYKKYFDRLISTLGVYNAYFIGRIMWTIVPQMNLSLFNEIDLIKQFISLTNDLIYKNHPNTVIVQSNVFETEKIWQNKLEIHISKSKREILNIKYLNNESRFSLNNEFIGFLRSDIVQNKTVINYLLNFEPETDTYDLLKSVGGRYEEKFNNLTSSFGKVENSSTALDTIGNSLELLNSGNELLNPTTLFTGDFVEISMRNFLKKNHYPIIQNIFPKELDLFECTIDTEKRIRDLSSIKLPSEIQKWKEINKVYESNKLKFEGDYFIRSIREGIYLQDYNMRVLLGIEQLKGPPEEQLETYISIAKAIDWTKFLGIAAQCLSAPIPVEDVIRLMKIYKEARRFIEQIFSANVCNPFLKNGLKIIDSFELPVITTYNPNETLIRELESALYKILTDTASLAIKKALEAAAKACTAAPGQNFNTGDPSGIGGFPNSNLIGPFQDGANNDPALTDILDDIYSNLSGPQVPLTEDQKKAAKIRIQNIISDISQCLKLSELCSLYKGQTVNDEVYQIIITLVKRKYGSPYAEAFATREQINHFFMTVGRGLDLSICPDLSDEQEPTPFRNGDNILCDEGQVRALREQILSDRGLTPDLIDEALDALKNEEIKALEDILKILNSDNPFDFSKAPDLGCKVFPSGETIAPSMQSFGSMLNSITKTIYDTFDREAQDWFRTTYSVVGSENKLLVFNEQTGEIEPNKNLPPSAFENQKKAVSNSKSSSESEKRDDSKNAETIEENKAPSFIFKEILKDPNAIKLEYINENNQIYTQTETSLDGDKQQNLDLKLIETRLKNEVQEGEVLLAHFASKVWAQVLTKFTVQGTLDIATATVSPPTVSSQISAIQPIIGLLYALDTYLRKSIADSEDMKEKLSNVYKHIGINDIQEANAFFAAENASALYLIICEQLIRQQDELDSILELSSTNIQGSNSLFINSNFSTAGTLRNLLTQVLAKYNTVAKYYRAVFSAKINYPDYNIKYQTGFNKIILPKPLPEFSGSEINSFLNGKLYNIQRIETQKNKNNHLKITEITPVSSEIVNYITGAVTTHTGSIFGGLGINNLDAIDKKTLFIDYLKKKIKHYGFIQDGKIIESGPNETFIDVYEEMSKRIFNNMSQKIASPNNKFVLLKQIKPQTKEIPAGGGLPDASLNVMQETGSGQPYTQFLSLVIPQTPQQKACNIRPHYLDIDGIKNGILDEKANNICVEKAADQRVLGEKPISTEELKELETSSTQDAMLRGMYQLTTRIFLHDLLLRAIPIFGVYDPQSLRDEPAFISFMAKMCESEMRAFDNDYFVMMTGFLLNAYRKANPKEIISVNDEANKKRKLFRDLVQLELKRTVLSKLAKRISQDTNQILVNNFPKDTPIRLVNIFEDIPNLDIFSVKNKAIYMKVFLGFRVVKLVNNQIPNLLDFNLKEYVELKIHENVNASDDDQVLREFIRSPEYSFLFKYLFPITENLNNLFIISCLATTTRKQIINAFRGTKFDAISTSKIIQANGQKVASNPNNAQAISTDPMELIFGFLFGALIKTPISILKGVAESSEPNLALITTVFKVARTFVPKLPSLLIPAVSLPLGFIPAPVIAILPFANPLLAGAYFATLAWFDDDFSGDTKQQTAKNQEKNLFNDNNLNCADVLNQDMFYLDEKTSIEVGNYDINKQPVTGSQGLTSEPTRTLVATEMPFVLPIDPNNSKQKLTLELYNLILDEEVKYKQNNIQTTSKVKDLVSKFKLRSANIIQIIVESLEGLVLVPIPYVPYVLPVSRFTAIDTAILKFIPLGEAKLAILGDIKELLEGGTLGLQNLSPEDRRRFAISKIVGEVKKATHTYTYPPNAEGASPLAPVTKKIDEFLFEQTILDKVEEKVKLIENDKKSGITTTATFFDTSIDECITFVKAFIDSNGPQIDDLLT